MITLSKESLKTIKAPAEAIDAIEGQVEVDIRDSAAMRDLALSGFGRALGWALCKLADQDITINLRGVDFRGASLRGVDLRLCDLRGADFRGADLSGASFRSADLDGADFRGADLSGVDWFAALLKRPVVATRPNINSELSDRLAGDWMNVC